MKKLFSPTSGWPFDPCTIRLFCLDHFWPYLKDIPKTIAGKLIVNLPMCVTLELPSRGCKTEVKSVNPQDCLKYTTVVAATASDVPWLVHPSSIIRVVLQVQVHQISICTWHTLFGNIMVMESQISSNLLAFFLAILHFFPGGSLAVLGALHWLCHGRVLPRQRETCGQGRPVEATR